MTGFTCFRPGCTNGECGVRTRREVLYVDSQGEIAKAYIYLSFCSLGCEYEFMSSPGKTGIALLRTLTETHINYLRKHKAQPVGEEIDVDQVLASREQVMEEYSQLRLESGVTDPYRVTFDITTSGEFGLAKAEVRLKFASPSVRMAFKERCWAKLQILLYLQANYRSHKSVQQPA